jgi:hypothetical protein
MGARSTQPWSCITKHEGGVTSKEGKWKAYVIDKQAWSEVDLKAFQILRLLQNFKQPIHNKAFEIWWVELGERGSSHMIVNLIHPTYTHNPYMFAANPSQITLTKVEGVKINTPPKSNTYKHLPTANTLLPWTNPHGVGVPKPT